MERSAFRHQLPLTLHWGDMDSLGHVNNAVFFRYVESGRVRYFDDLLGHDPAIWGGQGPILARIECTFLGQLRYPAEITVGTRTSRLGGKSLTVEAAIFVGDSDSPVATSSAAVVWFDYENQATMQLPERVRDSIRSFEVAPPAEPARAR